MRRMGGPGARYNVLDDDDRARIVDRFRAGVGKPDIAREIGCSTSGVYCTLVKAGLHTPVRGKRHNSPRLVAARAGLGG